MAQAQTAKDLVDLVRQDTGIFDSGKLRDGFDADYGQAPRSILKLINEGLAIALGTGYNKCRLYIPVTAGTREYKIDYMMQSMVYVAFQGVKLEPKSIRELMTLYPNFLNDTSATQPLWYYSTIPDMIGLYPAPNQSDVAPAKSIEILAEHVNADLIAPDDIPERLIVNLQSRCRFYASYKICEQVAGEEGFDYDTYAQKSDRLKRDWDAFLSVLMAWAQTPEEPTVVQMVPDIPMGGDFGMEYM